MQGDDAIAKGSTKLALVEIPWAGIVGCLRLNSARLIIFIGKTCAEVPRIPRQSILILCNVGPSAKEKPRRGPRPTKDI
ncbi:hypothetical protein BOTCAL_0410g00030 [Botryotinia calthae]|uniref:Uncharacterized protein n=1 Tax=Botryotinia calthae TaxID=38488 RepID=A0A4Y8CS53_9HELO|nr:hypothetical protein BOTCAL_0410g00030 [Botryotinia calthae]